MTPVRAYLEEIRATRSSRAHTKETSFYPALKALLDGVGSNLKPRVRCIMNLRNLGDGLPDGGLFTADQLDTEGERPESESKILGATPSRGAIEVKPPNFGMEKLAKSDQASRYGNRYRHVLLTNLREFWLVEQLESKTRVIEKFTLADSEEKLWALASQLERQGDDRPELKIGNPSVLVTNDALASISEALVMGADPAGAVSWTISGWQT